MNEISCNICMDLVPLVKDGISSEDSCNAVMNHIEQCENCKKLFDNINNINKKNIEINDKKVISKIKNHLIIMVILMVTIGSFIGVIISESELMFYNIVIMPIIGGISYFAFNKKAYIVPLSIFIFTYIWIFIKYFINGEFIDGDISSIIIASGTWAVIYGGLCILGIIIGFLLYIAFKKESK